MLMLTLLQPCAELGTPLKAVDSCLQGPPYPFCQRLGGGLNQMLSRCSHAQSTVPTCSLWAAASSTSARPDFSHQLSAARAAAISTVRHSCQHHAAFS